MADRAAEPLASAAMIGLNLSSVRNLDAVLERARQADQAINSLYVIDQNGTIVVSTAGDHPGTVGPETLRRLGDGAATASYKENGDYRYLVTFKRLSGDVAGGLLMEYSGAAANTSVWAMTGRLATAALIFCLISGAFLAVLIQRVLRGESRIDQVFLSGYATGLRGLWRGEDGMPVDPDGDDIARAMREADERYMVAKGVES
ncbi:hypothetical protein [Thalassovita gelatinovora]|uniref:hypothetical protein n=1 Tax=Thalassovita gelatinovora TaxID=53501 RepID=UPI00118750C4|nr:hypothetical protein [Thalassovita gelatinovora]QIZ82152.1 hypothetical protein HFZ77_17555 [Thalassovita gelatinovora]